MKIPQKIQAALDEGRKVFSFEYFPPKTADGVENLFDRMDRMVAYQPAFCDITWGAGGSTADLTLEIATRMQNNICVETSMHLTCTNMPMERIDQALLCHEYQKDLEYLKAKMDAGADLIVTQLFYDVDIFLKFVADCRAMGVSEPIIPGIMPITTYGGFKRMTAFCKTKVPQSILDALEPIKDNEEAVRAYGIQQGTEMCRRILDAGIHTLHMYTLNQDKTTIAILKNLGLIEASNIPRALPWRPATNIVRCTEDVRPIYWSYLLVSAVSMAGPVCSLPWWPATSIVQCTEDVRPIYWSLRPKSYRARTAAWTKFPSGLLGPAEALCPSLPTPYPFVTTPYPFVTTPYPSQLHSTPHRSLRPKSYLARTAAWTKFPSGRLGPAEALSYSDLPAKHRAFLKRKSRATALARDWAVPVASTEDVKQVGGVGVMGQGRVGRV
ncbi:unnamed protein product [Closterium sp. NIES-53]